MSFPLDDRDPEDEKNYRDQYGPYEEGDANKEWLENRREMSSHEGGLGLLVGGVVVLGGAGYGIYKLVELVFW